jgi:hypothetical protein
VHGGIHSVEQDVEKRGSLPYGAPELEACGIGLQCIEIFAGSLWREFQRLPGIHCDNFGAARLAGGGTISYSVLLWACQWATGWAIAWEQKGGRPPET